MLFRSQSLAAASDALTSSVSSAPPHPHHSPVLHYSDSSHSTFHDSPTPHYLLQLHSQQHIRYHLVPLRLAFRYNTLNPSAVYLLRKQDLVDSMEPLLEVRRLLIVSLPLFHLLLFVPYHPFYTSFSKQQYLCR